MKITANTQDYARGSEPAVSAKSSPGASEGLTQNVALHVPIEVRPIEASAKSANLAQSQARPERRSPEPDQVQLSAAAMDTLQIQEELHSKLKEELKSALEAEPIDLSDHRGMDYAPDAIAQRVVDFSVGLYGVFRDKHPALAEQEAQLSFGNTVRGATENAVAETLGAQGETSHGFAAKIEETQGLIDAKLDRHFAAT